MKLLLLGANGQVGHELRRSLAPLGEVVAATRDGKLADGGVCEVADFDHVDSLAALVGVPTWSATTRKWSRSAPRRSMVRRKLCPRGAYTQAVRRIAWSAPLARIASSPASLLAPYTPSGDVGSSSRYGRVPRPTKT